MRRQINFDFLVDSDRDFRNSERRIQVNPKRKLSGERDSPLFDFRYRLGRRLHHQVSMGTLSDVHRRPEVEAAIITAEHYIATEFRGISSGNPEFVVQITPRYGHSFLGLVLGTGTKGEFNRTLFDWRMTRPSLNLDELLDLDHWRVRNITEFFESQPRSHFLAELFGRDEDPTNIRVIIYQTDSSFAKNGKHVYGSEWKRWRSFDYSEVMQASILPNDSIDDALKLPIAAALQAINQRVFLERPNKEGILATQGNDQRRLLYCVTVVSTEDPYHFSTTVAQHADSAMREKYSTFEIPISLSDL